MKLDQLAALARAPLTLAIGAAVLYSVGRWLGWRAVGAIVIIAIADMSRWPAHWRPW
jgi:hypothetical protein